MKIKLLFKLFILFILILTIAAFIFLFYIIKDFPRPEVFSETNINQNTNIYDRTGKILLSSIYGEEKRKYVHLKDVPENLKHAIIATEDANFYNHIGIDFKGMLRAIKVNLKTFSLSQGASTIHQQLIRSTFLSKEKTADRKIKEIILALELDRRYDKDQILEWYINQVPFGINIYGAEEAANTYFQKPLKEISLEEAATLAAIIQLPSYYSPYGNHLEELFERKDYVVLKRMQEEGFITEEEAEEAKNKEIVFNQKPQTKASHFVTYVRKQLEEIYGTDFLETKGLKIYTSLDYTLQEKAEEIVKRKVSETAKIYNTHNSSLMAMDPKTGEILAMVGSADPWADPYPEGCNPTTDCKFVPSFNVATLGNRQPGSAFKPFTYAETFSKGYDPDRTLVKDEYTNFGYYGGKEYIPQNFDGKFRGWITLRSALNQSLNIPAVKVLLNLAGTDDTVKLATKMGLTTLNQTPNYYGPSLGLGGAEVRLLDMVAAYSVFANEGYKVPPVSILKIEDPNGNIVYENNNTPRKVLASNVAETMMDVLSDNASRAPMFGWNSFLYIPNYKVAVKTGTTQNFADGWTMGTCDLITVGVWCGNNDHSSMVNNALGSSTAGPIWNEFINYAINYLR